MNNLINEALKRKLKLEILKTKNIYNQITVNNDKLKNYETSNITNYEIKVTKEDKTFIITREDISNPEEVFKDIEEAYNLIDNADKDTYAKGTIKEQNKAILNLNKEKVIEDFKNLYKLKKEYKELFNIESTLEYEYIEKELKNTDGADLQDNNATLQFIVECVVKENNETKSYHDYYYLKEYDYDYIKEITIKVIENAMRRFKETSIKSKKSKVILSNYATYQILKTYSDMFSAEKINKSMSILANSYLKQVFSPLITIIEDPLNKDYPGKQLFDAEGTKTCRKTIIDNGKFITKLYNNKEAIKDKTSSTGNANGVRNMYLVPGEKSFKELIKEMKDGIVLTRLSGLHIGANKSTGDLSLQAEGYLVKNGKRDKSLNMILLSANLMEVFNNVISVGNDLKFGSKSVGAPSILCDDIMIVGED